MATLFSRDWTAPNGTPWSSVGFERVFGGSFDALVANNRGEAGATASERVYRATAYPTLPDYKVRSTLTWLNPSGAARVFGVGARWTSGGGYTFEVGSNLGSTVCRVRRLSGGTWTDLSGWVGIASEAPPGNLSQGVVAELRVQNTRPDTVSVRAFVAGSEVVTLEDVAGEDGLGPIQSGGTGAIYLGPLCTADDVTADDMVATDFEDEATAPPSELGSGASLIVNGVYYSEAEWEALGVTPTQVVSSFAATGALAFLDLDLQQAPVIPAGAVVSLALDGTIVATGTVRRINRNLTTDDHTTYEAVAPRALASEVPIRDPDTNSQSLSFNMDKASEYYSQDRADLTLGEMIAYVIDLHLDGDGGLRDIGAISSSAAYVQAELDAITPKINKVTVSGNVIQSIDSLLAYVPSFALWIDPATLTWHFRHRPTGAKRDIDLATGWLVGAITENPGANFTRVRVVGTRSQHDRQTFSLDDGSLLPAWRADLEAEWTAAKQWKNRAAGTVGGVDLEPGSNRSIDPVTGSSFSMVAHEWIGCRVTFTDGAESGNAYNVDSNTAGRIIFKETTWVAGGPAVADAFRIEGRGKAGDGGRDNGFTEVGTLYKLADPDLDIAPGTCITAKVSTPAPDGNGDTEYEAKVAIRNNEAGESELKLDLPTIGMLQNGTPSDSCIESAPPQFAPVLEFSAPVVKKSDPTVPALDEPPAGFRGTAYSSEPLLWNGGGQPRVGDHGVKRILTIAAQGFQNIAEEAEYRAMAAEILAVSGMLAREVRVTVDGLDPAWGALDYRLTISHSGGEVTGEEDAEDLWPMSVEWDLMGHSTTIVCGTVSNGQYNLSSLRARHVDQTRYDVQQRLQRDLDELYNCVQDAVDGAGAATNAGPNPICADQVEFTAPGGGPGDGKPISTKIVNIEEVLKGIGPILSAEKGGQFGYADKPGGNPGDKVPAYQDQDGDWWVYTEETGWVRNGDPGSTTEPSNFKSAGGGDESPWPNVTDGHLGGMHAAMLGILANLGKTIDKTTGRVLPGGTTVAENQAVKVVPNDQYDPTQPEGPDNRPFKVEPVPAGKVGPSINPFLLGNKLNHEGKNSGEKPTEKVNISTAPLNASGQAPVGQSTRLGPNDNEQVKVWIYPDGTTQRVSTSPTVHHALPQGGAVGVAVGKCGSTMGAGGHLAGDGTAANAGQADLIAPGETVGAEGAMYYPPTQATGQPHYNELPPGSVVPSSTTDALFLVVGDQGIVGYQPADPGGTVYETRRR